MQGHRSERLRSRLLWVSACLVLVAVTIFAVRGAFDGAPVPSKPRSSPTNEVTEADVSNPPHDRSPVRSREPRLLTGRVVDATTSRPLLAQVQLEAGIGTWTDAVSGRFSLIAASGH